MDSINFPIAAALVVGAGLLVALASPVAAESIQSHYTSIAEKACKKIDQAKEGEGDWSSWSCPGRGGYVLLVTEDDLRMTVSVGRTIAEAENEPAAKQGFPAFNHAHDTVEWRSVGGKPFAIIQRWTVGVETAKHDVLVVTRLPPGPVCHVAEIDAKQKDANLHARKVADEKARTFRCKADQSRIVVPTRRGMALAD
jgi:hypothetical protein